MIKEWGKFMRYLMECGHVAQGNCNGKPACAICLGITPKAEQIKQEVNGTVGLENRKAKCFQHNLSKPNNPVQSKWELPFFEYCPDKEFDKYYCGCHGWD